VVSGQSVHSRALCSIRGVSEEGGRKDAKVGEVNCVSASHCRCSVITTKGG